MEEFAGILLALLVALVIAAESVMALLVLYLLFLTFAAIFIWLARPGERLGRDAAGPEAGASRPSRAGEARAGAPSPSTRFALLVPAHDEEVLIERVVKSLLTLDYPRELFTVHVIADNCTDGTAELARAAGATVHERHDPDLRGKGYALRWLLTRLLGDPRSGDAFVIVDADSVVNRMYLRALDRRLAGGAVAVQAYNTVLNVGASWGTSLRYIAFALLHYLRPLGRKLYGGSAGLKGNGMCFRRDVLAEMEWGAFSVTEDLQFHLDLLRRGHVVELAPDAVVWSDMPETLKVAQTQNARWESGRLELLRSYVPRMIQEGLRRRSVALLDAALDNIVPPFSVGFALVALLLAVALLTGNTFASWLGLFNLLGLVFYTIAGLLLVRAPGRVYLSLLYAPFYIVWKLAMWLPMAFRRRARQTEWTRTERGRPARAE